jgi:hypothetical protein
VEIPTEIILHFTCCNGKKNIYFFSSMCSKNVNTVFRLQYSAHTSKLLLWLQSLERGMRASYKQCFTFHIFYWQRRETFIFTSVFQISQIQCFIFRIRQSISKTNFTAFFVLIQTEKESRGEQKNPRTKKSYLYFVHSRHVR